MRALEFCGMVKVYWCSVSTRRDEFEKANPLRGVIERQVNCDSCGRVSVGEERT